MSNDIYWKWVLQYHYLSELSTFIQLYTDNMQESRKFCQRGSNFDNFFFVYEGREDPNTTISGSLSARQQKGHLKRRFACRLMMTQHWMLAWYKIRTNIARKPIFLWIFRGQGVWTPCSLSWLHGSCSHSVQHKNTTFVLQT